MIIYSFSKVMVRLYVRYVCASRFLPNDRSVQWLRNKLARSRVRDENGARARTSRKTNVLSQSLGFSCCETQAALGVCGKMRRSRVNERAHIFHLISYKMTASWKTLAHRCSNVGPFLILRFNAVWIIFSVWLYILNATMSQIPAIIL